MHPSLTLECNIISFFKGKHLIHPQTYSGITPVYLPHSYSYNWAYKYWWKMQYKLAEFCKYFIFITFLFFVCFMRRHCLWESVATCITQIRKLSMHQKLIKLLSRWWLITNNAWCKSLAIGNKKKECNYLTLIWEGVNRKMIFKELTTSNEIHDNHVTMKPHLDEITLFL